MTDDFDEFFDKVGTKQEVLNRSEIDVERGECAICKTNGRITTRIYFDPPIKCDKSANGECNEHVRNHCYVCAIGYTLHIFRYGRRMKFKHEDHNG